MNKGLISLFAKMAHLTKTQCIIKKKCLSLRTVGNQSNLCCAVEHCLMVKEFAKEIGVELTEVTPFPEDIYDYTARPPYLNNNKECTVPPHIRQPCTLHICEKLLSDQQFAEEYFNLREKIETLLGRGE